MTAYRFRRRHLTKEKDIRIRFHHLFISRTLSRCHQRIADSQTKIKVQN